MKCNLCPRQCNINRKKVAGFCSCKEAMKISKVMKHFWEEPIISAGNGSGAIFFSGCNLKCIYCQNYEISNNYVGEITTIKGLVEIIKKLEQEKVNNINFVTPTHFSKQIVKALKIYKPSIPIVWNSSGYESEKIIKQLKKYVDIYLVDLKYMENSLSQKLSNARDYPEIATKAILTMRKNQPKDIIENGKMKKGMIVRHLVIPNHIDNSFKCLDWIKESLGTETIVSIMSQYTPEFKACNLEDINRKIHPIEYKRVLNHLANCGFKNGFTQELDSANSCYIPDFKNN